MYRTEILTGPTHWASALINGDDSGLDEQERTALDAWIRRNEFPNVVSIKEDSERFTWFFDLVAPELGVSGGDVCDYIALLSDQ